MLFRSAIHWLVRTELLHEAMDLMGGFQLDPEGTGNWGCQDAPLINELHRLSGGNFFASPEATLKWRHHRANTSGVPGRIR